MQQLGGLLFRVVMAQEPTQLSHQEHGQHQSYQVLYQSRLVIVRPLRTDLNQTRVMHQLLTIALHEAAQQVRYQSQYQAQDYLNL